LSKTPISGLFRHGSTDSHSHSQYLIKVRNDLERVRMLAELVRKREQEKLRQAQILRDFVRQAIFPLDGALKVAFEKIMQCVPA
jgi:hypothetical protein